MFKLNASLAFIFSVFLLMVSCQKEADLGNVETPVDSTGTDSTVKDGKLFQVFYQNFQYEEDNRVLSIDYDTINFRTKFYLDDTTNTNPYDQLIATFQYDSDGYLTSYVSADQADPYSIGITRDNNKRVLKWIQTGLDDADTTYFSYTISGENTVVKDSGISRNDEEFIKYVEQTVYNKNNQPLNYASRKNYEDGTLANATTTNYTYNTEGVLTSETVASGSSYSNDVAYTYDAANASKNNMSAFKALVLGKDYYLLNYQTRSTDYGVEDDIYPLTFIVNDAFENEFSFLSSPAIASINSAGTYGGEAHNTSTSFTNVYDTNNRIAGISLKENTTPYMSVRFVYK